MVERPATRLVVLGVVILGAIGAVSLLVRVSDRDNERRLLEQQTAEAGAVLEISIGQITGSLEAIVRGAAATEADAATFTALAAPLLTPESPYTGVTLFDHDAPGAPVRSVGERPYLLSVPAGVDSLLDRVVGDPFVVVELLDQQQRTLGFGVADDSASPRYVAYAEYTLSVDPGVRVRSEGPFSNLDYAIYFGTAEEDGLLLGASTAELPISSPRAMLRVDYGDSELLFVTTPIGRLGSGLGGALWWIVLVVGGAGLAVLLTLVHRIELGRRRAEELASDHAMKHLEQREVAETLALGLLPQRLVAPNGTNLATRYWSAGSASWIGGDFYDVFRIEGRRWGILIGDVCGKGVEAAADTALIRQTVRTACRYLESAADVLHEVHRALADHDPPTFCTACFIIYHEPDPSTDGRDPFTDGQGTDTAGHNPSTDGHGAGADGHGAGTECHRRRLQIALGGHPQPLMMRAGGAVEPVGVVGTILGMVQPSLSVAEVFVEPGDTLFLYTDGITDAPGSQAVPLSELMQFLGSVSTTDVDELVDSVRTLKRRRRPLGSTDDTAVVALRFVELPIDGETVSPVPAMRDVSG